MDERLKAAIVPMLGAALVLGCVLRFIGLTRGDLEDDTSFYHFHPDQQTLIEAAQRLETPTDPPLTAYGLLPIYLAAGALKIGSVVAGYPADLATASGQRLAVISVRTLSALLSCLTLWLLWVCGQRYFGRATACIAVVVVAVVPLAVQQAHFYTVDGVFTLIVVAAFHAILVASKRDDRRLYLLCGALVGAAGAVRLNGLLTGLILLAIHLARPASEDEKEGILGGLIVRVRNPLLWLSGLAAVVTLVAIQPYIVTDPGRLVQSVTPDDLAYFVSVARGEFLRVWSLVDVHTVPYLHFWSTLWPTGVGWPLTLAFLVSIGHAVWRPRWHTSLLVLWLVLYFIPIGGLHTKHVRYLLPMLPFLALLFGDTVRRFASSEISLLRNSTVALSALILAHAGFYGIAFAGIYHAQDSRLAARRWLDDNVQPRARIAVEHGGFSMKGVLNTEQYRTVSLNMGMIFGSRGYLNCEATSRILRHQLDAADFIAITDVNRYRQFTAVPEVFPVVSAFYADLVNGNLGFDVVGRFKVYPRVAGFTFDDDEAEPSFLGYDHPAVVVLRKAESFTQTWDSWQRLFHADERCAHAAVTSIAEAVEAGDHEVALDRTRALQQFHPELRFSAMIQAYLLQRLNRPVLAAAAADRYSAGYGDPSLSPYLIAPATAISLMSAGLDDLGLAVLEEAVGRKGQFAVKAHLPMARAYGLAAELQQREGKVESAYKVLLLAAQLHSSAESYNALAELSSAQHDYDQALTWWDESLRRDVTQVRVHRRVAQAVYAEADYGRMIDHLQRVLDLQPGMNPSKRRDTLNLLGALSDSTGQYDRAQRYWQSSLSLDGDQAQIHRHLGLLLVRMNAEVSQSLMHLDRAAELAPALRPQLREIISQLRAVRER